MRQRRTLQDCAGNDHARAVTTNLDITVVASRWVDLSYRNKHTVLGGLADSCQSSLLQIFNNAVLGPKIANVHYTVTNLQ